MKALRLSLLSIAALPLSSCDSVKSVVGQYDYAIGSQGNGYFLTVAPKPKPAAPVTSAKAVTDPQPRP